MFKNNDEPGIELVEWHHSPAMTADVSILIKAYEIDPVISTLAFSPISVEIKTAELSLPFVSYNLPEEPQANLSLPTLDFVSEIPPPATTTLLNQLPAGFFHYIQPLLQTLNVPATTLFAQGNNTFYADSTGVMHNNLGTAAPVNTDNEFSNQMIMTG